MSNSPKHCCTRGEGELEGDGAIFICNVCLRFGDLCKSMLGVYRGLDLAGLEGDSIIVAGLDEARWLLGIASWLVFEPASEVKHIVVEKGRVSEREQGGLWGQLGAKADCLLITL